MENKQMNLQSRKTYNLAERRPQVLVIGNGLVRAYEESKRSDGKYEQWEWSWTNLINKLARDGAPQFKDNTPPATIHATAVTECDDKKRRNKFSKALAQYEYKNYPLIDNLLQIPFDAILTTNYTYELEYHLNPSYITLSNETKRNKFAYTTDKKSEEKYLLRTYNRIEKNGLTQNIWHIHGELRRPSSIILTHDEYARLVNKILEFNNKRGDQYSRYYDSLEIKSWVDYFLMGDLYILGLGMDFSEFDMWWLLSRRLREKNYPGTVTFFSMADSNNPKIMALSSLNVKCDNCGFCERDYIAFYKVAIQKIKSMIERNDFN